jgi:multiple sugar transport system ATP-binding protein
MVKVVLDMVSKHFNGSKAVDKISLEIQDQEFMSILGPSGCGKTTLLRLIAGLENLSEGKILFNDKVMNDIPPGERNVSMVFQSYALFPHMTVAENIGFPLSVRKISESKIDDRVKEVCKMLGLSALLERKPKSLSGGEQQRVAVGRAIVRKPDVLLMDEPLSNVDAKTRAHLRAELKELQRDVKTTLVYVTHDQTEAMTMSHRISLMKNGKLIQTGTPEEIYEHPTEIWSASFVGSLPMNFFNCKLIDKNGVRAIGASCFAPQSPENIMKKLQSLEDGSKFSLGVRPEDIEISKTRSSKLTSEAIVHLLEPMGDSLIVTLNVSGTSMRAKTNPGFKVSIGETVFLSFDWSRSHVFLETEDYS